jgi:hypothetical protein
MTKRHRDKETARSGGASSTDGQELGASSTRYLELNTLPTLVRTWYTYTGAYVVRVPLYLGGAYPM